MSDSIKKWHEMQEEKGQTATGAGTFIYESPDGGKTVTQRPFAGDISERVVIQSPPNEIEKIKKEAYSILVHYSEEAVRYANKLLNVDKG